MKMEERVEKNKKIIDDYMKEAFNPEKPYVFISYSHAIESADKVYNLLVQLMEKGVNFAIDTEYRRKRGDWIKMMSKRLVSEYCKSMMSFYCRSYIYSRPSILEQLFRFTTSCKDQHDDKPLTNIYISLFKDENISKHIVLTSEEKKLYKLKLQDKVIQDLWKNVDNRNSISMDADENKIKNVIVEKAQKNYILDEKEMKFYTTGLSAFFGEDYFEKETWEENINDFNKIESVRELFIKVAKKDGDWNNANMWDDVSAVLDVIEDAGVLRDDEIAETSKKIIKDNGGYVLIGEVNKAVNNEKLDSTPKDSQNEEHTILQESLSKDVKIVETKKETSFEESNLWHCTSKGADAYFFWEDENAKSCIVKKGSRVAKEAPSFETSVASAYELKQELKQKGILVDGVFQSDYVSNRISTVYNLVCGGSINMRGEIKNGKFIKVDSVPNLMCANETQVVKEEVSFVEESIVASTDVSVNFAKFIQKASENNFKKSTYDFVSLIGAGACEKYSVYKKNSTADLALEFIYKLVNEYGESYILDVLSKNPKQKNPFFVKTNEVENYKLSYKIIPAMQEWSVCTNWSQCGWMKVLSARISESDFMKLEQYDIILEGCKTTVFNN